MNDGSTTWAVDALTKKIKAGGLNLEKEFKTISKGSDEMTGGQFMAGFGNSVYDMAYAEALRDPTAWQTEVVEKAAAAEYLWFPTKDSTIS